MPKKPLEPEFVVTIGVGKFPFDMLRYDHCVPATEQDADTMGRTSYDAQRVVILKRYRGIPGYWTPARWKSFGWPLIVQADPGADSDNWLEVMKAIKPFKSLGDAQRAIRKLAEELTKQRI